MANIYMTGVDVSHHNKVELLADIMENSAIDFVIAKATEGETFKDKTFDKYMDNARAYGLFRGAYHYVNPKALDVSNAIKEAENFVSYVRPYSDCILALDFEEKKILNQSGVEYLLLVAMTVQRFTGTLPLIYMSESTYRTLDFSSLSKLGCGLWAAKWGKNLAYDLTESGFAFAKATSNPFSVLAMQQISSKALWNSKEVALDVDVAFMGVDAWKYYANPRLRK